MIQRILNSDDKTILRTVKKGHLRSLVAVPIAFLILFILTYNIGYAPAHRIGDWSLSGWELIFVCSSVIIELLGIFWFQLSGWEKRNNKTAIDLWSVEFSRLAMIFVGPVCGYILRFTGSGWHVVSLLFMLSILALIITFPTDNRIAKWRINQNTCIPQ